MRTVSIRGPEGRLAGTEAGTHGAPILFLHGYPDDHEVWSLQLQALSPRFRVAAFDLRGVGGSEPPASVEGYRAERIAADIDALIEYVGAGAPVHIVAHDWGSMLAWLYVSDPRRARRVASFTSLSGPHPGIGARSLLAAMRGEGHGRRAALSQLWRSRYVPWFRMRGLTERVWRVAPAFLWRAGLQRGGVPAADPMLRASNGRVLARVLGPLELYRQNLPAPPPALESITLPVQLIHPRGDAFVTPVLHDQLEAYAIHVTRREVDGNHWVMRSHPDVISRLVEEFVTSHSSTLIHAHDTIPEARA